VYVVPPRCFRRYLQGIDILLKTPLQIPHAQGFTKWKIFLPLRRHCGPNSALKVLLIPDTGEATSKIKLDLLSLKILILHCLKEGGIQKWKTAHRCLARREREKLLPSSHNPRTDVLRGQYLYHFVRCNGLSYMFKIATISSYRAQ